LLEVHENFLWIEKFLHCEAKSTWPHATHPMTLALKTKKLALGQLF
jgi:hypothetical protein